MKKAHTKKRFVTMEVYCEPEATDAELRAFIRDLEWVGGCRSPTTDPLFSSVSLKNIRIRKELTP